MPDNAPSGSGYAWATKAIQDKKQQEVHIQKTLSVDDEGMPQLAFSRMAKVIIPVSLTSGNLEVDVRGKIPEVNNLTFIFENLTPWDIVLEGGKWSGPTLAPHPHTSWVVPARTVTKPLYSKKPDKMAAYIWNHAGNPIGLGTAVTNAMKDAFIALYYGRGN